MNATFKSLQYILVALFIFNIQCTDKAHKPFSFAQICDTQLGMGGYQHDLDTFKQSVKQINELEPDFVVICGDLVNHASDSAFSDFMEIREGFNMPCYVAAGNHDVGNIPNDTTLAYYRKTIGKDYYEFENNGYSFIVTNTQLWKNDIGRESDQHDRWFGETLAKQNKKRQAVIVIGHHPLFIDHPEEKEEYFNIPPLKRQDLLKLFLENNVVAYLSGHTHKKVINNYKNIQLVSGETTSKNFDKRPFGFRLWNVSADTINHHFVALQ